MAKKEKITTEYSEALDTLTLSVKRAESFLGANFPAIENDADEIGWRDGRIIDLKSKKPLLECKIDIRLSRGKEIPELVKIVMGKAGLKVTEILEVALAIESSLATHKSLQKPESPDPEPDTQPLPTLKQNRLENKTAPQSQSLQ